ncbi:MAG: hypothetical protein HEQ35_31570 [Gloeotrichia echinulata IR180]
MSASANAGAVKHNSAAPDRSNKSFLTVIIGTGDWGKRFSCD